MTGELIELLQKVRDRLQAYQPLKGRLERGPDRWRYVLRIGKHTERRYIRQADREEYQRRVRIGRALQHVEKALEELKGE